MDEIYHCVQSITRECFSCINNSQWGEIISEELSLLFSILVILRIAYLVDFHLPLDSRLSYKNWINIFIGLRKKKYLQSKIPCNMQNNQEMINIGLGMKSSSSTTITTKSKQSQTKQANINKADNGLKNFDSNIIIIKLET